MSKSLAHLSGLVVWKWGKHGSTKICVKYFVIDDRNNQVKFGKVLPSSVLSDWFNQAVFCQQLQEHRLVAQLWPSTRTWLVNNTFSPLLLENVLLYFFPAALLYCQTVHSECGEDIKMLRKNVKRGQLAVPWEQADFTPSPPNKALQIDFRGQ